MKIEFENYDTHKNISFDTDKSLILVYGKNGVGKTTLSRSGQFEQNYVFNEDFIYSNVYNINDNGATQTVKTKENFSGLWLGHDIVDLRKEITQLIEIERVIQNEYSNEKSKIISYLNNIGINIEIEEQLKKLIEEGFELDLEKTEIQKAKYKSKYNYSCYINTEEELQEKINKYKQNDLYKMLVEKIKNNRLLAYIILNEKNNYVEELNKNIDCLNKQKNLILEIENVYKQENIDINTSEKIKEWYTMHENRDYCLFCGNNDIKKSLEKWRKVFSNEYIKQKSYVIGALQKDVEYMKNIVDEKNYSGIDKELIDVINDIANILKNKIDEIKNNMFFEINFARYESKIKIIELSKLIDEIVLYILEKNKNVLGFFVNASNFLVIEKNKKTNDLDKLMNQKGDSIASNINGKFKEFGLCKNIVISVDRRSNPHKFTYSISNHQGINELSDGQKHKLALAIFMNYLEEQDLKDKIIVIDDPVVSLDIASYILFKKYLTSKLIKEKFHETTKLIILTHDISYLYIQASNIFENEKLRSITELYKLTDEKIQNMPLDFIKTDDITLFRDSLDHLTNLTELYVLNSIINKIYRILIDLKLRFFGISISNEIGLEKLSFDDEIMETLRKAKAHIVKIGRKENPEKEEILESIKCLKETADLLGFIDFIKDEHITKIEQIIEKNIDGEISYELFDVISSVQKFLKNSKNEDMKHYVEHTRNSYTRNLIGLSLDDYFDN